VLKNNRSFAVEFIISVKPGTRIELTRQNFKPRLPDMVILLLFTYWREALLVVSTQIMEILLLVRLRKTEPLSPVFIQNTDTTLLVCTRCTWALFSVYIQRTHVTDMCPLYVAKICFSFTTREEIFRQLFRRLIFKK